MPQNRKRSGSLDTAGWVFWAVAFVLFAIGFNIAALKIRTSDASVFSVISLATVLAAVAAAVVSWVVNSVMQQVAKRRRIAERKAVKRRR